MAIVLDHSSTATSQTGKWLIVWGYSEVIHMHVVSTHTSQERPRYPGGHRHSSTSNARLNPVFLFSAISIVRSRILENKQTSIFYLFVCEYFNALIKWLYEWIRGERSLSKKNATWHCCEPTCQWVWLLQACCIYSHVVKSFSIDHILRIWYQ